MVSHMERFHLLFWLCPAACGILVLWPGIELGSAAVTAHCPNHWAAREFWDFIFFLRLSSIPLCICIYVCIHLYAHAISSLSTYLLMSTSFHILATVNNAAVNIVPTVLNECFLYSLDIYLRMGYLSFLRNFHTVFLSGYTSLHPHQPFSPYPCEHLLFLA